MPCYSHFYIFIDAATLEALNWSDLESKMQFYHRMQNAIVINEVVISHVRVFFPPKEIALPEKISTRWDDMERIERW